MAFWNKKNGQTGAPAHADIGRNDPCHCGSGKKYKKCCIDKDATAERKQLDEAWKQNETAARAQQEQNEKKTKEAKENPAAKHVPTKSGPTKSQHATVVTKQVNMPRKSGGG